MQLNVETLLSNPRGSGSRKLASLARDTMGDFFKFCPATVPVLNLTIVSVERGGNVHKPVRIIPSRADGHRPSTLPVAVYTEGTQAVHGFVSPEGVSVDVLRELIEKGPYHSKPKLCPKAEQPTLELAPVSAVAEPEGVPVPEVAKVSEMAPANPVVAVVKPLAPEPTRLTPLQKLRAGGFPEEDIERLKATLSVILQEEMVRQGLAEVPNTLRVKVRDITAAIIDHMRLPRSSAGTYRGIVGAFYSSRITLFALKYDEQDKGDEMYADWLFDCDLVIDFIGGKDQLEALARIRRQEVSEREAKEATREPSPPAAVVEEAVLQDSLTDEAAVALTLKWLEGKKEAQQAVALAQENLASHEERLARLLAQVEEAHVAVEGAKELVKVAEKKFSALELSEEVRTRLREAKERVLSLCSQVGI